MNYSFFISSKKGSCNIRGLQIAHYLGGKINPKENYEDDICIFIKHLPKNKIPTKTYIDIIDRYSLIPKIRKVPNIGIITLTDIARDYISKKIKNRHIEIIPQHHCNFEHYRRPQRKIKTVGYIGSCGGLMCDTKQLQKMLSSRGLSFIISRNPDNRHQTIDFFKQIDINIAFRNRENVNYLKDSIKIYNAGSFGIPTVAYPTPAYEHEFKNCYLPAKTMKEIVEICSELANNQPLYNEIASKSFEKSKTHHIDNIISYYKGLQ